MNVQFYIESGMLEQYVLGKLCAEESKVLEDLCARHPELAAERDAIEQALFELALSESKKAPTFNKEAILKLSGESTQAAQRVAEEHPALVPTVSKTWRIAAMAASLAALLGFGLWFVSNQDKSKLAQELANVQSAQQRQSQELQIIKNPNYKAISLTAIDTTKVFKAAIVYYNAQAKDVYLAWNEAAKLNSNEQYQLWAIVDGKPVDAGVFNEKPDLQKMKLIGGASAFAITIEKAGGSVTPTLSKMVCMGKV